MKIKREFFHNIINVVVFKLVIWRKKKLFVLKKKKSPSMSMKGKWFVNNLLLFFGEEKK